MMPPVLEQASACKECGGKCCQVHPHISGPEYRRMARVLGAAELEMSRPVQVSPSYWQIMGKCPGISPTGCKLKGRDRPLKCRLYPFEIVKDGPGLKIRRLLLDIAFCPHWELFARRYEEAMKVYTEAGSP